MVIPFKVKQPKLVLPIFSQTLSMKKHISLLLVFGLLLSCNDDDLDCSTVSCVGPPVFLFEILNNGENVIENEAYPIEAISINGTDDDSFTLDIRTWQTGSSELTGVFMNNEAWEPQVYEISLDLGSDFSIPMVIAVGLTESGGCCGGIPKVDELRIQGEPQGVGNGGDGAFTIILD
jgi:hypothetical protein